MRRLLAQRIAVRINLSELGGNCLQLNKMLSKCFSLLRRSCNPFFSDTRFILTPFTLRVAMRNWVFDSGRSF